MSQDVDLPRPLFDAIWQVYDSLRGAAGALDRLHSRLTPSAVAAALLDFDGSDWDALARQLLGISEWSEPARAQTPTDDAGLTDGVIAELNPAVERRLRPLVAYAVFALLFYVSVDVSTRAILGADVWEEIQNEVATVLGLLGFFLALDQRKGR